MPPKTIRASAHSQFPSAATNSISPAATVTAPMYPACRNKLHARTARPGLPWTYFIVTSSLHFIDQWSARASNPSRAGRTKSPRPPTELARARSALARGARCRRRAPARLHVDEHVGGEDEHARRCDDLGTRAHRHDLRMTKQQQRERARHHGQRRVVQPEVDAREAAAPRLGIDGVRQSGE